MTIKRFTQADWYAYAGAANFKNGEEPFIYKSTNSQGVELVLIGDAQGIELSIIEDDDMLNEFIWSESLEVHPIKMEGILRHIIEKLKLKEDWYAPDLTYILDHTKKLSEI